MLALGQTIAVLASASLGTAVGFCAGLVPGLHMNNIAAGLTSYAGASLAAFAVVGGLFGVDDAGLLVSCFLASAVIAHIFGQSITNTYVGIPSEDVVSVLPAHRLAKAGLGIVAVRASADGALVGTALSSVALIPSCIVMGWPVNSYALLRQIMGVFMIFLAALLILSEGFARPSPAPPIRRLSLKRIARATMVFFSAGLLGYLVLSSGYYSAPVPDVPWIGEGSVSPSSLLLPMFAGLFGIPGLILSLGSRYAFDAPGRMIPRHAHRVRLRDLVVVLVGGTLVGWMPGMTSGSAASVCASGVEETRGRENIGASVRFIWLYSSISASGAVFALGALFVIMRARSGSMDAISSLLGSSQSGVNWLSSLGLMTALLFSMLVAASLSRLMIDAFTGRLSRIGRVLCSKELALASLAFVVALSITLTGSRGALLMFTAAMLGLLPPLIGVRRIQLMGCLLVPISIMFLKNLQGWSLVS